MEAAVCSVAQNIAEGKGRQYKKEFIQFLYISEGSLFETLTLAEIMKRRRLMEEEHVVNIKKTGRKYRSQAAWSHKLPKKKNLKYL